MNVYMVERGRKGGKETGKRKVVLGCEIAG